MALEITLGGVPREDLDDEGKFLPGKEDYHRQYNPAWGGYRGIPEEEVKEPAPRKRKSAPAQEPEPEPEVTEPAEVAETAPSAEGTES